MTTIKMIIALTSKYLLMISLIGCSLIVNAHGYELQTPDTNDKTLVSERIKKIFDETLRQGEFIIEGVRATTRVPPSKEAVEEIKRYGDNAVPVLEGYLHSESARERSLAIDFLGGLGGKRIIAPLRTVIQGDKSPALRKKALLQITEGPWDLASPVIREASETDPDASVRDVGLEILKKHKP